MNLYIWFLLAFTIMLFSCITIIVIVKLRTCPKDHICMHRKSFNKIHTQHTQYAHHTQHAHTTHHAPHKHRCHNHAHISSPPHRDIKVINDPLYPPLNRTDRTTFDHVVKATEARDINVPTTNINDTYRLVGYLINNDTNQDAGGNRWKVMARQKNRHESDFYLIPTNKDYDVKVPLTTDVVLGKKLNDVYTIPKDLRFNSPLLNNSTYEFVELPKSSFGDSYN